MLYRQTFISLTILQLWSGWTASALAQQTFFPSAVPLAVRTPTFSCWLDTHNGSDPMATWPIFWNDLHNLGWTGFIKVDGTAYHWLGSPPEGNASAWIQTQVTPTRTILTVQAGPMLLNVTFLSPIEPSDLGLQSFPFSYVYVDATAMDGQLHSIQLYSDISGEWVTDSLETQIQWSTTKTNNTMYHQFSPTAPFSMFQDVPEDGTVYHAVSIAQSSLVSIIGTDETLRGQFATPGEGFTLTSDLTGQVGPVRADDTKFPVLAHAVDLGSTATISSVAWAVGVVRDPVMILSGVKRGAYYWSQYATIGDAIDAFVTDFPAAKARALALDDQILQDAGAISQDYVDLISLGTRQALAGIEITLSTLQDGSFNLSDIKAFMKDVGNSQRVNPIEGIYAALPALMYLMPNLTGTLLEPLLEYQNSSNYTNPYAASDLGSPFPQVSEDSSSFNAVYGVENSGNMLILVLAHAQSTGDGSLIGKYYSLLKQWADYLTSNALIPGDQTSADARDEILAQNHPNVTNLALKGIIGIQAMAKVSQIMGQEADAQNYKESATSLIQSWVNLTSMSGQLRWTYDETTFGLMYNLLADKLLGLDLVPASIYTAESTTLSNNQVQAPFGFPLSSDNASTTRSGTTSAIDPLLALMEIDWTLFSAAAAPDNATRNLLISTVRNHASSNFTDGTFPTLYNVKTGLAPAAGVSPNGFSSPAQGAVFSLLALNVANHTVVVPSTGVASSFGGSGSGGSSGKSHTGEIVGGVMAGLAVLLVGIAVVYMHHRRIRQRANTECETATPYQIPTNMTAMASGPSVDITNLSASISLETPSARASRTNRANPFLTVSPKVAQGSATSSYPALPYRLPSRAPESNTSHETDELRSEMARLRQEVDELRANQEPPGYQ
ncbi:hypothetical protein MSAN_00253700 [Mycena sanguinolenta]|uniref:DUF1793-domain-containing protein n=1 Tax=Mycena sanguinolenta TaxID=230812 RepID=A0A8H7DMY0_9AGAR|nr:hypothetical protein MSAN_00253700 [Mycena sanguinolenta]